MQTAPQETGRGVDQHTCINLINWDEVGKAPSVMATHAS